MNNCLCVYIGGFYLDICCVFINKEEIDYLDLFLRFVI